MEDKDEKTKLEEKRPEDYEKLEEIKTRVKEIANEIKGIRDNLEDILYDDFYCEEPYKDLKAITRAVGDLGAAWMYLDCHFSSDLYDVEEVDEPDLNDTDYGDYRFPYWNMDSSIKEWYTADCPSDEQGYEIRKEATFQGLRATILNNESIGEYISAQSLDTDLYEYPLSMLGTLMHMEEGDFHNWCAKYNCHR